MIGRRPIGLVLAGSVVLSLLFPKAAEELAPVRTEPLRIRPPDPVYAPIPPTDGSTKEEPDAA